MQATRQSVMVVKQVLNKKYIDTTHNAISFLNILIEEDIRKANIKYMILTITWERKVVKKYQHLDTVQAKIDIMNHQIKEFIKLFSPLFKRGLPSFWEEKGGMWSQKDYNDRLINSILDHKQFEDMQQSLSGKIVVDKLAEYFEMMFNFKATCAKLSYFSYVENVELRVLEKEMVNLDFPTVNQWKTIEQFGKKK